MRLPSLKLLAALVPAALALGAAPAQAAPDKWSGLIGLNAASGASWVREYAVSLPSTLYAATEGGGVYRSTNLGLNWTKMSGLDEIPGARNVRTVFTSGSSVYAGTTAGLFKSTNGGAFQPVAQGPEEDPKNPKKLNGAVQAVFKGMAGQWLAGVASGGVYKSTDDGATWKPPAPGNGMPRSETVWSFGSFADGLIYAATQSGIYVSTDFGSTWTLKSDGISGVTLRAFADDKNPNIYYAAGSDGVFRSYTAGLTWSKIEGPEGHRLPNTTVRALRQFSGDTDTRLYVGTNHGVYAGTTDHSPLPGEVKWRKVTAEGFGSDTIVWALASFPNTPATLLAGNQANGGYALTFTPPVKQTAPTISGEFRVGQELTADPGQWAGTPTIDFEYQWQYCTTTQAISCHDIEGAVNRKYVLGANEQNDRIRVVVTASNDVPTFGLIKAESAISAAVAPPAGTVAGSTTAPSPGITAPTLPQPGHVITANDPAFNPAATLGFTFQWYRCNDAGAACEPIPGAGQRNYTLTDADVGSKLCATATGRAAGGATTSGCGTRTNIVLAPNPVQTAPTTLTGKAYVGDTLASGVGAWKYPGTRYERQWERCNAEGGSCETIQGAKGATYKIGPDDLGDRLRVRISVDSNAANQFPAPVEVFSPLSAVVTNPPAPPATPAPTPAATPAPQSPPPAPPAAPAPDTVAPVLGVRAVSAKLKPGAPLQLQLTLSEGSSLSVAYERKVTGRKAGKQCKAGAKKGKKCTAYKRVATVTVAAAGGASKLTLPKRKLAAGSYRAVVTPVDAAGNRGAARTIAFKVVKKK